MKSQNALISPHNIANGKLFSVIIVRIKYFQLKAVAGLNVYGWYTIVVLAATATSKHPIVSVVLVTPTTHAVAVSIAYNKKKQGEFFVASV